ncbi:MAG: MFS family permease [Parvibaculaceae bacterium]|jgi:MFS family permease|nr:MFS transporter [Parvibaculaceae bacterium]
MSETEVATEVSEALHHETPGTSGTGDGAWPNPLYAWYVIAVLVLAYTFSFIDRQILGLLIGPMKRDLQISDFEMSLLQGFAFALFYTLMGLPIGRMVDSKNRVKIITIGIALWSLMTALCGIAQAYWQLFIYRMGVGVGEAALSPSAYSMISDYFKPERMGTALGVYGMGVYLGAGMAFIIGAEVVGAVSGVGTTELPVIGEVFPWQIVFLVVGIPGLGIALWAATLKEPIRRGVKQDADAPSIAEVKAYMGANGWTYTALFMCYALSAMMAYGASAWTPEFLRRTYDMNIVDAGRAYGWIIMLAGTAGVICGGWSADKLATRFRNGRMMVMAAAGVLTLPGAVLTPLMNDPFWALMCVIPTTFFATFTTGVGPSAMQELTPNRMRGLVSAVMLFVVSIIGLGIGPTAIAAATDFVFQNEQDLWKSLLVVPAILLLASSLFGYFGLKSYLKSRDYREAWEAKNT